MDSTITSQATLRKTNALSVLRSGHLALAEIEGLRELMIRGLVFNYLIFIGVTLLLNGLFYYQLLKPFIEWVFGSGEGFWAATGAVFLWSIQVTVAAVFALAALRFSMELASLRYQSLVRRIIQHFRQIEEQQFSLKVWLAEMKIALREAFKACVMPLLLLFIGVIPLIGLPVVFVLESHWLGRESIIVYLESLADPEEAAELRKTWRWLPIRLGWLPTALAFIPFLGWLFLPLSLIYEVIGFAFQVEQSRN